MQLQQVQRTHETEVDYAIHLSLTHIDSRGAEIHLVMTVLSVVVCLPVNMKAQKAFRRYMLTSLLITKLHPTLLRCYEKTAATKKEIIPESVAETT